MKQFGLLFLLFLISSCDLETVKQPNAFGEGYDLVKEHKLFPTGWVTNYQIVLPGPKAYFSRSEYKLVMPFTPKRVQGLLKHLRVFSAEVYSVLSSFMNHDPMFTYQLSKFKSQITFQSKLSAPEHRNTLMIRSDVSVLGQLIYINPEGDSLPFKYQVSVPQSNITVPNPFNDVSQNVHDVNIPKINLSLFSSDLWKNVETHLDEPGFLLSGGLSVQTEEKGLKVVSDQLKLLSTLKLGRHIQKIKLQTKPGLSFKVSEGPSQIEKANIELTHQAQGDVELEGSSYRMKDVRIHAAHVIHKPPSMLSKFGLSGTLQHQTEDSQLTLELQNQLWMKQDAKTGQLFKSRNYLTGSLKGMIPFLNIEKNELMPEWDISQFGLYLDGGDQLEDGLPEKIRVCLDVRGARVYFGTKPIALTFSFRIFANINLARQTFWSRDNVLMMSLDQVTFEGDERYAELTLDPGLKHVMVSQRHLPPLDQLLKDKIITDQNIRMTMISGEALRVFNLEGSPPPLVKILTKHLSTIRIIPFDEARWNETLSRAHNLEKDFNQDGVNESK